MLAVPHSVGIDSIDALLPQTQCQRCGYADCRDYAASLHAGEAEINRCPPGGEATRVALGELLQRDVSAIPALADDVDAYAAEHVALIDETACIGCAKCLPVCPTDAIVGAAKRIHTVIAEACTGCELCIIACPVDCISLRALQTPANWNYATLAARTGQSMQLRDAYTAHKSRYALRAEEGLSAMISGTASTESVTDKKALLAEILAKAKTRTTKDLPR
ncbi:MAG: RnfABCDGE type electron transport complex subunit B [Betaproteobacteria bacterium]|nr:MAG: RnfABCDGE type electron transport complex subunit B [Betaproteobacteria bacterium]